MHFPPAKTPKGISITQMSSDKSISHRAAIVAAMSDPDKRLIWIKNYSLSEDTLSTVKALENLGVKIEFLDNGSNSTCDLMVKGIGLYGIKHDAKINVGNSGTLMRLLAGWLVGQPGRKFVLDGDESIRTRPMNRVVEPLSRMCVDGSISSEDGCAPLKIEGGYLRAIDYVPTVDSSQVKGAVLLAGLMANGITTVNESRPTRAHTEELLIHSGGVPSVYGGSISVIPGNDYLNPPSPLCVPNDISSAAFLMTAAVLLNKRCDCFDISADPTRHGFLWYLAGVGRPHACASLSRDNAWKCISVSIDSERIYHPIQPVNLGADSIPSLIDELPLVALIACFAKGQTKVEGAAELRFKESDRISAIVEELSELGADIEELEDGFVVNGKGYLEGGEMDSRGDHRIAMMGAIAGLASEEGVKVNNFDAYKVSYPTFLDDLEEFGLINS